jgi:hypothetical protein
MSEVPPYPFRVNVAHIRKSNSDSGLGVQANVVNTFKVVPPSLGSDQAGSTGSVGVGWELRL